MTDNICSYQTKIKILGYIINLSGKAQIEIKEETSAKDLPSEMFLAQPATISKRHALNSSRDVQLVWHNIFNTSDVRWQENNTRLGVLTVKLLQSPICWKWHKHLFLSGTQVIWVTKGINTEESLTWQTNSHWKAIMSNSPLTADSLYIANFHMR